MFSSNPRKSPSLPQNDSPTQQAKRKQQIIEAQSQYIWTNTLPNVIGVPMSKTVPESDKPTIEWFLKVIDVALEIVENTIANATEANNKDYKELQAINVRLTTLRKAHAENTHTGFLGLIETELARFKTLFLNDMGHGIKDLYRLQEILDSQPVSTVINNDTGLSAYQALFKSIKLNTTAEQFQSDELFAYFRVAGPNPILIQNISAIPENFALNDAGYQSVMGSNDSINKALTEKRLFLLDYQELQAIVDNPGAYNGLPKQLFAPMALFAKPSNSNKLVSVAIQRTQNPASSNTVYATVDKTNANYWPWQTEKSLVQMADGNYHELFVHLARTHLLIEAFALATHRSFALTHPINVLLLPHFEGTLFINNAAVSGLIAAGGPIDNIFAGKITQSQSSAGADRLAFDFYDSMLPNELSKRGLNNTVVLPDYPYRDDGLLIWNAIHTWVNDYINVYYNNDNAVSHDTELSAWVTEVINNGKVKGFKTITGKTQLVDVLTMIIFTGSAQHAAVNFPQSTIMTYAPAISGAVWGTVNPEGATESDWLKTLAPIGLASKQLDLLHLLGGVYYRMLGNYQTNDFPYPQWFADSEITGASKPLERFQQALKNVETQINQRNTKRQIPYTYLLPSKIPMSINI